MADPPLLLRASLFALSLSSAAFLLWTVHALLMSPLEALRVYTREVVTGQGFVFASEDRLLYSLLSNLLANAVEASPRGGEIVAEFVHDAPLRIAIRNKGAVPKEVRDHFFEKYKTHGKPSGAGLGTYSAKLLADAMGYGIAMRTSDADNETCITLSIPLEQ